MKSTFNDEIHRLGRISTAIIIALFLSIPIGITIFFAVDIDFKLILVNTLPLAIMMGIAGSIEKMSMTPIMGPGAVYVSSTTGNVSNMKFPAAINAMSISGYEQGSEESQVVALIAVCTSALVTTTIIFMGVIFLAPMIQPILANPMVKPAFDNMFPSLLGAMATPFVLKSPKISITPIITGCIAAIILGNKFNTFRSLLLPIIIGASIGIAYLIYKSDTKKDVSSQME